MRKFALILLILFLSTSSVYSKTNKGSKEIVEFDRKLINKYLKELKIMNSRQLFYANMAYKFGSREQLGYTMLAIAWEESHFNEYGYNPITGDYGLMGINLKYFLIDHKIRLTYYNKLKISTRLIRDDEYNLRASLVNLKNWVKKYKGDWYKIWGCYNGGNIPNYYYAKRILNRLIALKIYFKKHPDIKEVILNTGKVDFVKY